LDSLVDYFDLDAGAVNGRSIQAGKIKVLIADPFLLFRQVLARCLKERADVEVVAAVKSPTEYRKAQASLDYHVAIVASELFEGTHSTAPLGNDDFRLHGSEAGGASRPVITLVADEDIDAIPGQHPDGTGTGRAAPTPGNIRIHRGSTVETLVEAMKSLVTSDE